MKFRKVFSRKKLYECVIGVTLMLYIFNRFALKPNLGSSVFSYLMKYYFNDYLGGILIVAYSNFVLSLSIYSYRITSLKACAGITLLCGLFWEYIFPMIYPRGTADPFDVIAYILGGFSYYLIVQSFIKMKEGSGYD